jgi:hypothetical protein
MSIEPAAPPWSPDRARTPAAERHELTLAVLTGARSVVRRGWLQDGWFVLEAADGRRRFVGAGSLTPRSYGTVVQACLVGAVAEAAFRHTRVRGLAGPAIDALWQTLTDADPDDAVAPSPAVRAAYVRELTRWNDRRDRTQDDVVSLLDVTIDRVQRDCHRSPVASPPWIGSWSS